MTDAKYKVGDWVRANPDNGWVLDGAIGKVAESDSCPYVDWQSGVRLAVSKANLEPWRPRVGEKVRALRTFVDITAGNVYEVNSTVPGEVRVIDDAGDGWWLDLEDIEPAIGAATPHTFTVGDRVRGTSGNVAGLTATVAELASTTLRLQLDAPQGWANGDDSRRWWVAPAEIESDDAPKFKVGDRVRVVKRGNSGHGRSVGEEFTLKELRPGNSHYGAFWSTVGGPDFYPDEIELATPTPLRIEAGKFYMTRDGRKVGPMERGSDASPGFYWRSSNSLGDYTPAWRKDGKFYENEEFPLDLIAEAPTATAATTAETGTAIVCLIRDGKPLPATAPYVHESAISAHAEADRLAALHKGDRFGVYRLVQTMQQMKPTYDHEWQRLAAEGQKIAAIRELRGITGLGLKATKDAVEGWLSVAA